MTFVLHLFGWFFLFFPVLIPIDFYFILSGFSSFLVKVCRVRHTWPVLESRVLFFFIVLWEVLQIHRVVECNNAKFIYCFSQPIFSGACVLAQKFLVCCSFCRVLHWFLQITVCILSSLFRKILDLNFQASRAISD